MMSAYFDSLKGSDKEHYERKLHCLYSEASIENHPIKSLAPYTSSAHVMHCIEFCIE